MKVLWFTNGAGLGNEYLNPTATLYGGGWIVALENTLREQVELHIAYYYPKYSSDFEYKGVYNYPICRKNWKIEILKNAYYRRFTDQEDLEIYLAIIEKVKPDIIHIHGTENPFGCLINKVNIPVVVSIQGIVTVIAEKLNCGIEKEYLKTKDYNLKNGLIKILLQRSFGSEIPFLKKMKDRELRNFKFSKYIIGRTDWDRRVTSVLSPGRIYYHCEESLRDQFYTERRIFPSNNDKLIIHSTSKNSALKGFETICAAIYELNDAGFTNFEWRVAGISESDLIVKVVKRSLKNKFPTSSLIFLGNLNETQLIEKLLESDVYVMASHIENSPNNLCEAMILGIPCIATFAGGTGTILKDGIEGILIQDNDPWAMAGAVLELKNDVIKATQYGQNARNKALKRHDKSNNITELLRIYKSVSNDFKAEIL